MKTVYEDIRKSLGLPPLSPEQIADEVCKMFRRAVLRELQESSPENQLRVVVFWPFKKIDHGLDTWLESLEEAKAVIVNPNEGVPVVVTSKAATPKHEPEIREIFKEKAAFELCGLLAQKIYGPRDEETG